MTSITRTKLLRCRVKDCEWPEDEAEHHCWGNFPHGCDGTVTHQHVPKKGMGGHNSKSRISAILCQKLHQDVDQNGIYKNEVCERQFKNGTMRFYRLWKPGEEHQPDKWALIWREIPNGTDDSGRGNQAVPRDLQHQVIHGGEPVLDVLPDSQSGRTVPDPARHEIEVRGAGVGPLELTFEAWAEQTRSYAMAYRSMGWLFGDHCLAGLDRWGDEAHQIIDQSLGVAQETVANWLTTCRIWPPDSRRHEASFTMHALLNATRRKDPEEADRLLDEAIAEGRTSSEVRALLSGPVDSHECPDCGQSHRRKA